MKTQNTQTYLKLFDYQSCSSSSWRTKIKTCEIMQPFKRKKKISTELLLGIYLTKLNEEERRMRRKSWALSVPDLGRGKEAPHPSHSPFPYLLQGLSEYN